MTQAHVNRHLEEDVSMHLLLWPILGDNHGELPCVDGLFYAFLCVLAHACDGA